VTDAAGSDVEARLRAAGCVYAEDEAALLREAASGPALTRLVARRVAGEPLEQVLGWASFGGLRVGVAPGVFVPRRRTELLVREAVAVTTPGCVVVDLCCGCGAVGLVVAATVPGVELHAADVDPVAVACARDNLAGLGAVGATVHLGDLVAPLPARLRGRVGVLAANAPYVPTAEIALMPPEARDHEPVQALDGGPDGLALVRRIAAVAGRWLAPGGHLLVESSDAQSAMVVSVLGAHGFDAWTLTDEEMGATVVVGRASLLGG
jgi:release factor glutamine methyltransferase